MNKKAHIIFIHTGRTAFVRKDIELLSSHYSLMEYGFVVKRKIQLISQFGKQFFSLFSNIWKADLVIAMFAGYHTFLPGLFSKIFGKPFVIILGGTESVSYPSIGYGNYTKPIYGFFTKVSLKMSDLLAPVHRSLLQSSNNFYPFDGIEQGVFHHVKGLNKEYFELPNGFSPEKWHPEEEKIPNSFITVAVINDHRRYVLKGVDLIFEVAKQFPQCHFTVIGLDYLPEGEVPANVEHHVSLKNEELKAFYGKHEFYFQLSISEGHPNALCEAMLCRCIPIGSQVAAIPEIIGDTGFLLSERKVELLASLITEAMKSPKKELADKARQRIIDKYPVSKREERFHSIVKKLTTKAS